jgi:hypothetical protein
MVLNMVLLGGSSMTQRAGFDDEAIHLTSVCNKIHDESRDGDPGNRTAESPVTGSNCIKRCHCFPRATQAQLI